ncbi:DUF1905 domain-containing protein [Cellulomonas sp. ATA003]|uniref:DUF1905 domain-containing protein n=1 Tax=Cellulomonas sp. ATA003 TaxID=3073064 RepID=UPI002872AC75|nr:DUF1905 domain-containing protein [Cellulomonas sp. ATA003]WNB86621.1 DUF1905 domain-containing protein [Cellulomonas sp. ATA003]
MTFEFDADLWLWDARRDSWTFVSLPTDLADDVLDVAGPVARGFGSVRVEVTLGATTWRTSIFPDSARRTYVLPVKKAVRTAEHLTVGDTVHLRVRLVDA